MIARPLGSQQQASPAFDSHTLVDFFNHGALPFVGRTAEAERLIAFWQGTAESQGLRGALLLGEAGVGKSRLIEEVLPRIVRQGGVVIHAKLYPGATTSIIPLIARAIRFSGAGRQLLKKEPEDTLESAIGALQRLARLRPLLLVLEDMHLLGGEALGEFAILLEALSSEAISFLALARPIELPALGVIERYLVDEVILEGFTDTELKALWEALFHAPGDPKLLNLILKATHGNGLALRSALRGMLKSGALVKGDKGSWESSLPLEQFKETLERNVQILSEGMAAHLTPEEKLAAERFASLGEVFSREAAHALRDDAQRMIDNLLFKGILIQASTSISPLPGATSRSYPLAFTHTLLHKHFSQGAPDTGRLIAIIGGDLPLYSIVPFQLLAQHAGSLAATSHELRATIDRGLGVTFGLDETHDWLLGRDILNMAERVFELHRERWQEDERREIEAKILTVKLNLLRRVEFTKEYNDSLERLSALTAEPAPLSLLEYAIHALKYRLIAVWRKNHEQWYEIWSREEELLGRHPTLKLTHAYITFLREAASSASAIPDAEMLRICEERLDEIMASPEATEEFRRYAHRKISVYFLKLFETPEELEDRLRLLADLENLIGGGDLNLGMMKIPFFETIGATSELCRTIDAVSPRVKERGLNRPYFQYRLIRICEEAPFGVPLEEIESQTAELMANALPQIMPRLKLSAGVRLARVGLFRDDPAWQRRMIDRYLESEEQLEPHGLLVLARAEGRLREALDHILETDPPYPYIVLLARLVVHGGGDARAEAEEEARRVLRIPFICREDLLTTYSVMELLEAAAADQSNAAMLDALLPDIRFALDGALEWLNERGWFAFMRPLLARYGRHLGKKQQEEWSARADALAQGYESAKGAASTDGRIKVTMLGTIEVTHPGAEPIRLRGARLRTVLGLLVADRLLEKPLTYREFCRLAAGGEDDPERARKMVSMAILRLRESVGQEIVRTTGEAPQLDLDRVQVDLLDAQRLLREATEAARHGALMRALPLLTEAFALIGTEVPFPSLYDEIFEAIREDFEFQLRQAVIAVGKGLLEEGDAAAAEEALRRGFDAMPEDEEIATYLYEALERQGKKAEAERARAMQEK